MTNEEKAEICYECTGYGEDYFMNENGDFECRCDRCWINSCNEDDEDE